MRVSAYGLAAAPDAWTRFSYVKRQWESCQPASQPVPVRPPVRLADEDSARTPNNKHAFSRLAGWHARLAPARAAVVNRRHFPRCQVERPRSRSAAGFPIQGRPASSLSLVGRAEPRELADVHRGGGGRGGGRCHGLTVMSGSKHPESAVGPRVTLSGTCPPSNPFRQR